MTINFVGIVEIGQQFNEYFARISITRDGVEEGAFLRFNELPTEAAAIAAANRWVFEKNLEANPVRTTLTHLEFRSRFTFEERVAIDNGEFSSSLTAGQKATLRTLLKDMEMAQEIDLAHPDIATGLGVLESMGLIEAGRSDQIMSH